MTPDELRKEREASLARQEARRAQEPEHVHPVVQFNNGTIGKSRDRGEDFLPPPDLLSPRAWRWR